MIARISGKIIERNPNRLIVDVNGISYEVFLPVTVMQRIDGACSSDAKVNLITYHYHQLDKSRGTPVLIGFLNDIEKEFFEIFITVSGIGPRAALKALNKPISVIAKAIDEGDVEFLKSLPGIGQQRAREIIAKLQNKVGKFGLMRDASDKPPAGDSFSIKQEAIEVLTQLEYKRQEAVHMINTAIQRNKDIATTEELLNEVYKQKKGL